MSSRRLQDMSPRRLGRRKIVILKTCLEDALKTCLEDVLKTCLEDVRLATSGRQACNFIKEILKKNTPLTGV